MSPIEEELEHEEVARMAVEALNAASRRAAAAGHSRVVGENGYLVRIDQSGTTVLKELPARVRVTDPNKKSQS